MKRFIPLLLSAALLLTLLPACREPVRELGERTAAELADEAFSASGREDAEGLESVTAGEDPEWMSAYLENAYGLQDPCEDGTVVRSAGASAFEITVLRMADEPTAVRAASAMTDYLPAREGDFAGYAPAEADIAANGKVLQAGPYAALFICPDPDGAYQAVETALYGESNVLLPTPALGGFPFIEEPITDVKELLDFLVSCQEMEGADLEMLDDGGPDALTAYIQDAYGLTPDQWEEAAIARGTGDSAFEAAVFRVRASVWDVEQSLNIYLNDREAQFDSSTEQAKLLHRAIVVVSEPYIVLLACQDAESMAMAFAQATGAGGYSFSPRYRYFLETDSVYPDRCKFTPPNKDDMSIYDTSAILAAWEKDDPAGLPDYDRSIYDQAKKVLNKLLKDGMSDYEKERAVYEWMVQNVDYDWTHQDAMKETPRESFTPYGGLVNHKAVCLGYATTFQLLMDLAGVECITVAGAAHESSEDHGWNMVQLDGAWYCVDATWDANMREDGAGGGPEDWSYFNITSDDMAASDHQWDYANTPEAVTEGNGRG